MILFQLIQKPQLRGAELFASQLSQHLEGMGHRVYLVALYPGNYELPFTGEKIYLNRSNSMRWTDYRGWKTLATLIKKYQPDIVQCNAGDTLKYAVLSKLLFKWRQPIIARNASMVSLYIHNPFTKWVNRLLYKQTDWIISVSEHSKKDLNDLFPHTQRKSTVIPIGVTISPVHNVDLIGGKSDTFHIIHVGGFSFEKNHVGLLRIFKHFLSQNPNSHLHLLGNGPLLTSIQSKVEVMDLQENVTFYGWVSNPIDYIAKADVLVLPSVIEGLPGVLLEAMSVKTPVIAYNVGGISEVVDEKTGYLITIDNENSFIDAMVNVKENRPYEKIQNGFTLVEEEFSNENIAKKFEVSYYCLIKKNEIK